MKTRVRKHRRQGRIVKAHRRRIKGRKIKKKTMQSLFHAGDYPPSLVLEKGDPLFGFSSKEAADSWKKKHNKEDVYQFQTDSWDLDPKQYSRDKKLSDNEFIAHNVLVEEELEDD